VPNVATSHSILFAQWIAALETRHLANLRLPEVTRALRALSSAYVQRRHVVSSGATLDGAGKRAAFALFYAPLHFLATGGILRGLDALHRTPTSVVDLGCGTGAAGAAWALAAGGVPVLGLDEHPWAVTEAAWTYRQFGLAGRARLGDVARLSALRPGTAIVAAYVLNELAAPAREALTSRLLDVAERDPGSQVLVIEPIARSITPWWDDTARRVRAAGGRADEWTLPLDLPPLVALLDKAAGLRHEQLKVRSLFLRTRSRHISIGFST
jgi:hypothetical protein